MIQLVIPSVTPSQNEVDRMPWWDKMKMRDEWYWRVRIALRENGWVLEKWKRGPMQVHIIRVAKRLIDDGNLPSGCKYLLDGLTKEGLLTDDSRKWCRATFDQRKCEAEEPHMEITVMPLQASPESEPSVVHRSQDQGREVAKSDQRLQRPPARKRR